MNLLQRLRGVRVIPSSAVTRETAPIASPLFEHSESPKTLSLMATLLPSFPHFSQFACDKRLAGLRLNSAMTDATELETELELLQVARATVPLYFDVKGRQMRVREVLPNTTHLDIRLNHPIAVETPTPVLFKAGEDRAVLDRIEEEGCRLVFKDGATHGPRYGVRPGESLHIRHPSLAVGGALFTEAELAKIERVRRTGFTRFFLSYVESQRDVDEFFDVAGQDTEVMLKIENKKGLEYVATSFRKRPHIKLVAARGDLYVEVDKPHQILAPLRLIIEKDPEAIVGSRLLLSVVQPLLADMKRALWYVAGEEDRKAAVEKVLKHLASPQVPSCSDFCELAWLYDIGYRNMLLCDELCLHGELLSVAVNAFESFRQSYASSKPSL